MSRTYRAGDGYEKTFVVTDAAGAAADADATPAGTILRNGAADAAVTVTITSPATGQYKAAATIPGSYAPGDVVELLIAAAVGGVATKAVVDAVRLVAYDPADAQRLGLAALPAAGTLAVKPAVTLAAGDVTGNLAADLQAIKGQSVAAAAPVTFPAAIGTSTYAGEAVAGVTAPVTVGTNNDKSGYALSAAGLDAISVADPGAPANHTTLARMLVAVWRALWKKEDMTAAQARRYADDDTTVNATAAVGDDGTTQTRGTFS